MHKASPGSQSVVQPEALDPNCSISSSEQGAQPRTQTCSGLPLHLNTGTGARGFTLQLRSGSQAKTPAHLGTALFPRFPAIHLAALPPTPEAA